MSWMQVTLSDNDVSAGRHYALQNAFDAVWTAMRHPRGARMYQKISPSEHVFYFNPEAVAIFGAALKTYGGAECGAPSLSELALLVGRA